MTKVSSTNRFRAYVALTKPGIMRANGFTAAAAYLFGAAGSFDLVTFGGMLAGICLIIASACVCNNYIDRGIDAKMERTKKRALVDGTISGRSALIFAAILGVTGAASLWLLTNAVTFGFAVLGFVVYVGVYAIAKRRSPIGTVIGSVSGAVPPVVGYTAATGAFDTAALLLFIILVCWQMPHFYAIAIFRQNDYRSAGIPVLPIRKGIRHTQRSIIAYITVYGVVSALLTLTGHAGYLYLLVILALTVYWLGAAWRGFGSQTPERWARKLFGISLLVLTTQFAVLAVDAILP